uniref:Prefoldin subunit 3 n=1 Tax=Trichuris muris TaxID=70415 RepID=A0A5S6QKQ0_TRIMR
MNPGELKNDSPVRNRFVRELFRLTNNATYWSLLTTNRVRLQFFVRCLSPYRRALLLMAELKKRVEVLEHFLCHRLNSDLQEATESLQSANSRLRTIRKTSNALKDILLLPSTANLSSKVDLSNGAFVQAIVPDASTVFIKVNPTVYVEMKPEEAIDLLAKLETCVLKVANRRAESVARINAHIKLVKQGLEHMSILPSLPDESD